MTPFDQRDGKIWLDGTFVDWPDAKLHVLTHGLHYASSIFEGIRVYGGAPFMLAEHVTRLRASARIMDFDLPYTDDELCLATEETVARAGFVDGYVRMNAWRGSEMIQTAAPVTSVHVSVAAWEIPSGYYAAADALSKGIALQTGRYRRPSPDFGPVKAKAAGNYMIGTICKNEALRAGFDDALLLDDAGMMAEATGAHIFFTRAGVLHTPTTRCTIEGITRATVLDLAARAGVECVVTDLPPAFLAEADGAFICGTACELLPVRQIDEQHYDLSGNTVIGQLVGAYAELCRSGTPVA
ncbi:MAG: aminotransferase class IV [Actinophytocola sp.]|uniref:aminotransferase class IV n=1 Tax=Actinophytocola sp. TaxID=1872138 RepID=UPI003C7720E2